MRAREAPARVDRRFGLVAQAPDARGDAGGEPYQHGRGYREHRKGQNEQALERYAAHRENRVGALLDHHRARDLVAVPDRVRGRDHHRLSVGRVAQAESRPALQRAGNLAAGSERVVVDGVVEVFARARDQPTERVLRQGLFRPARFATQAAGEREHAQVARHHPDARGRALDALENLGDVLDFAPRRGLLVVDDDRRYWLDALIGPGFGFAALGGEPPQLFLRLAPKIVVAKRTRAHQS